MRRLVLLLVPLLVAAPALAGCVDSGDAAVSAEGPGPVQSTRESFTGNASRDPPDATAHDAAVEAITPRHALTGHFGSEPSIGVTSAGALFVTAWDRVIRSRDGAATWDVVWRYVPDDDLPPQDDPEGGRRWSMDPMLWVDPATDRVLVDQLAAAGACAHVAWSDDEGASWFERPGVCHPNLDHQKLSGGPRPDGARALGATEYPSVLYHCYNDFVNAGDAAYCAVSHDGGLTWPVLQPVADEVRGHCAGSTGPAAVSGDGVVALALTRDCDPPVLALSHDAGESWELVDVPAGQRTESLDGEVAFAPDGTLFLMYRGVDHVAHLMRTRDLGATWDGPWRVAPPSVASTVFQTMVAGADGSLALAFLGTRDTDAGPNAAPAGARWHLFIVTSDTADTSEPTFTAWQVTPEEDPVQVGAVCLGGVSCDGNRNLLEFIDAAVAPDGTVFVAYTDGCTTGCAGNPDATAADSTAMDVGVAWLEGWRLHGASDEKGKE